MTGAAISAPAARIHALDSLRGSMMLLGIWIHAACNYVTFPLPVWPYKDSATSPLLDLPLMFIHVFRMPIFFVMAGFFARMLWERIGTPAFVKHRATRILLPFLVCWPLLFFTTRAGFIYANTLPSPDAWSETWAILRAGEYPITTAHLWFLYYLMYFYAAMFAWRLFSDKGRQRIDAGFRRLLQSPWRPLIFAIPTSISFYPMRSGGLDTEAGFLVHPKILFAYGIFFAFGFLLHRQADLLTGFCRNAWKLVVGAILLFPVQAAFQFRVVTGLPDYQPGPHLGAIITGAVIVWLLVFGLTGLFVRYLNGSRAWVRYLADASYWIYLMHLPLMIWIPAALSQMPLPALVKFALVIVISVPILLLSYHYLVRYTLIGRILNGPRARTVRSATVRAAPV
ncbi:MAG: acyltransferase family protein [Bryobacteraceae bacterium]